MTSLTATAISPTRIDLAWTDNSSHETGYRVYRSLDGGVTFALRTTTAANATSYSDTGGFEGTPFVYRVVAIDAAGESTIAEASVTTPPAAPASFSATAVSATQINFSWVDQSGNETGFIIQNSTDGGATWADLQAVGANVTDYSYTTAPAGASAMYRVRAALGSLLSSASNSLTQGTAPAAVTTLVATTVSQTRIDLSWTDVTGETGYTIQRSADAGTTWSTLTSAAANAVSYSDTSATEGAAFQYRIISNNAVGSSTGNVATATALPAAPSALVATPTSATTVSLAWTDNSTGETGMEIQRSSDGGATWSPLATPAANATSYTDTTATGGLTFQYRLRSVDAGGASAWISASATTVPAAANALAATPISATRVDLAWDDVVGVTGYTVQRSDDAGTTWNTIATPAANATSYSDTTAIEGASTQYRIKASNATGDSVWTNSSATRTVPAAPSSVVATPVSANRVDLTWTDNSTHETAYSVERSTDGGTTWTLLSNTLAVNAASYSDTAATAGTTNTYRVTALNAAGSSAAASNSALTVPTTPAGFTATVGDATHVTLAWTDVVGESSYRIDRSSDGGSTWSSVATPAANAVTATDATAAEATAYQYRILAIDATGDSAASSPQSVTTVPATPSSLVATPTSATNVNLTWTDNSGGETAYKVFRSDDNGTTWNLLSATVAPGVNAYSDTTVTGGGNYRYRVVATNGGGDSAASNVQSVTTVPAAPTTLLATATAATVAHITWTDVTGETGYQLQRSDDAGSTWNSAVTIAADATSYDDTTLTEATGYVYRLRAVNATGNSVYSSTANVLTLPAAPSALGANPVSANQVDLTWTDNSAGEDHFAIQRSSDGGTTWSALSAPAANATSYSDTTALGGTSYVYRISAVNVTGNSAWSGSAAALTVPAAPGSVVATAASAHSINVSWNDVTGESSYTLRRSNDNGATWTIAATPAANATSFLDTGLVEASDYVYKLTATDATGDSVDSAPANVTTLPSAPSNVLASSIGTNSVALSWTDHSSGETGFKVERSDDNGATWNQMTTTLADVTTYTDNSVTEASSYQYRVRAYNNPGNSDYSTALLLDTKPAAPTALTATGINATRVDLAWQDNSNGEAGYRVERSTDGGSTWGQVATLAANATSWSDVSATEATSYSYRVLAYRGTSISAASNAPAVTTVPATPTAFTATASGPTTIDLAWTDNSTNEVGYTVQRSTNGGTTWADLATLAANTQSYSDTTAPEAATTTYRVFATNAGGDSQSTAAQVALTPVAAPSALTATATAYNQVTLNWTDNSSVETGSKIERSDDSGATWTELHTVGAGVTTWVDNTVVEDSSYQYRVRATDSVQDSAYTGVSAVLTPLAPPTSLSAASPTATTVTLNWTDNSGAEAHYSIERSDDGGSTWANIFTVGAGVTTYTDTTASEATAYVYRVRATKSGNASAYAPQQTLTTLPATATGLAAAVFSTTEIDLTWTDNSSGETGYQVDRTSDGGTTWSALTTTAANATSYNDTTAQEAHTYGYRVHAIGAGGNAADSTPATGITPPTAPSGLTATGLTATSVGLAWTDNSAGETGYKVERSADAGSTWTEIAGALAAGSTTYTDSTASEGTGYVYRVRANRSTANSAYSNAPTVTTVPAAPTAQAATVPTTTRVVLNWTDNSTGETGYRIERAANGGAFALLTTVAPNTVTYSDNTVGEGQTYVYRVRGTNAGGDSLWSADMNAATAPAAPSALTGSAVAGQVTLNWTNNSTHQTGFKVERSTNGGSTWTQIATTADNVTTYTDTSVSESATYQYRVRAYNATTTSATSGSVSQTIPLNTPTIPTATTVSATQINLTWVDNSANESSYKVERSTDNATWAVIATPAANSTSYSDTTATEATTYYYRIRAYRSVGASAYSTTVNATTLPAAPTGLSAAAASDTQINLTWTDHSAGETSFTVERSADSGTTWSVLSSSVAPNSTTYSDTTVQEAGSYVYRVKANTAGGSSAYATSASVTALPAAPSGLTAGSSAPDRVELTWTDNSSVETGYKVERSTDNGSTWTQVTQVAAGVTSWSDVTVSEATAYQYRVRATMSGLNSTYTPAQAITTLPQAPSDLATTTVSTTEIDLTWTDNSAGEASYRVERSVDGGTTWTPIQTTAANATSYADTGVTEGMLYQYRIRAANATGGFSDYAATAEGVTRPAAPTSLVASAQSGRVDLTWHDNSVGDMGYKVERSADGGTTWSQIDDIGADSTTYSDTTIASSTTYDYRVRAYNTGGDSANSNTANVTTL